MEQKLHVRIAHAWNELRAVIDDAYAFYSNSAREAGQFEPFAKALRGFARDIEQRDRLEELLSEEIGQEIRHRRLAGETSRPPIKLKDGARLLILDQIVQGIDARRQPPAYQLFCMREAAHKAQVLGWLIAFHVHQAAPRWLSETRTLPTYSEAMGVK